MSRWDYCSRLSNKDAKAPTLFRDGAKKAMVYPLRREIFDFQHSQREAIPASATCLFYGAQSLHGLHIDVQMPDRILAVAAIGRPGKKYELLHEHTFHRNLNIPNE